MTVSIKTRILVIFLVALVSISGMTLWFSYRYDRAEQLKITRETLLMQATVYQQMFGKLLERRDFDAIAENMALLGVNPPVVEAAFLDDDLVIMSGIHIADRGTALDELLDARDYAQLDELSEAMRRDHRIRLWESPLSGSLMLLVPIELSAPDDANVGDIRSYFFFQQYDMRWIDEQALNTLLPKTLPILVLIVVLLATVFLFLNRLITNRLIQLSDSAVLFESGSALPHFDAKGNDEISHLAKVLSNLMVRIADEQRLLVRQNHRLEYIQRTARLGSFVYHPAASELEVSDELNRIFGFDDPPNPLPVDTLLHALHAEDQAAVAPVFHQSAEQLNKVELEFRFTQQATQELRYGYLTFSPNPELAAATQPAVVDDSHLGSIMDITPLKLAEVSLRRNLQLSQRIIDNLMDAVLTLNDRGQVELVNKAAVLLFEAPRHQLQHRDLTALLELPVSGLASLPLGEQLQELTRLHAGGVQLELNGIRASGMRFPARATLTRLATPQGATPTKYVLTCADLTQQLAQQQQNALTEKMAALGQLSAGIAHDFNNILAVLIGYADILDEDPTLPDTARRQVREIQRVSEHARTLTDNLLSYTRGTVGRRRLTPLQELVASVHATLQPVLTSGVVLTVEPPPTGVVEIDPNGFLDAALNLGMNALHAMPSGGQLSLKSSIVDLDWQTARTFGKPGGHYAQFEIRDTGAGMDEVTLKRIFEPFFTTKGKRGTGLGLAQVYNFVLHNDGGIKVVSQPGQGSCFTMIFPLVQQANS